MPTSVGGPDVAQGGIRTFPSTETIGSVGAEDTAGSLRKPIVSEEGVVKVCADTAIEKRDVIWPACPF
jgi:hypothetical protein